QGAGPGPRAPTPTAPPTPLTSASQNHSPTGSRSRQSANNRPAAEGTRQWSKNPSVVEEPATASAITGINAQPLPSGTKPSPGAAGVPMDRKWSPGTPPWHSSHAWDQTRGPVLPVARYTPALKLHRTRLRPPRGIRVAASFPGRDGVGQESSLLDPEGTPKALLTHTSTTSTITQRRPRTTSAYAAGTGRTLQGGNGSRSAEVGTACAAGWEQAARPRWEPRAPRDGNRPLGRVGTACLALPVRFRQRRALWWEWRVLGRVGAASLGQSEVGNDVRCGWEWRALCRVGTTARCGRALS
ncbi:hypothetical protein EV644_1625, partial [Kribbella orskensis]